MELTPQRSTNLSRRLFDRLCKAEIRPPHHDESEPSYTRSVLAPLVREELATLPHLHLLLRGDGGSERALPASALDIEWFPDLAVSLGPQNLWAAEVKILRPTNRQNSIATAFGQATLYRSRYEHVAVVLIDTAPSSRLSQEQLSADGRGLNMRVVIRPRSGKVLLEQAGG